MEPFSDLDCVLKVNPHCEACKMRMMDILGSIVGVYSISQDATRGLVKISGEVDPNMVLEAIANTGKHAEVVWTKLNHPQFRRSYNSSHNNVLLEEPYGGYHYCPTRNLVPGPEYYYNNPRYIPSYPYPYSPQRLPPEQPYYTNPYLPQHLSEQPYYINPYQAQRLPEQPYYPTRYMMSYPYPSQFVSGRPHYMYPPPARYVPSYPPQPLPEEDYYPYDNYESINLCSVM